MAVLGLAVLGLAVVVPLAGCGVPSSGRPVVVGAAPHNGTTSSSNVPVKEGPTGATDAQELVRRYLKAIAWGNEVSQDQSDALDKATGWAKNFFTPDAQRTWQRGQEITVVRARIDPPVATANGSRVRVAMQPIGTLNNRGTIDPASNPQPQTYEFTVVPAEKGIGLRIADPPDGMLLSDEGLKTLYDEQPIYFWDTTNRHLVPDLRYVNNSVSPANRLVQLTNWLRIGPSDYLRQAVNQVPDAIETNGRPVLDGTPPNAGVRVNLSAKAANIQPQLPLSHYVEQLRWSLRPWSGPIELQIERQSQNLPVPGDAALDNPAVPPEGQREPPRFCVVDGRARQLGGDPVDVPALSGDANSGVVSAAIVRGPQSPVALVRDDGAGRVRLWLGSYDASSEKARYIRTDVVAATMSQPVGLLAPDRPSPATAFLVAADGRLFTASVDGPPVDRTPGGIGAVTAVSVAPDGRRLALVAGGRAYVGVIQSDGTLSVGPSQELRTGLSDAVGVAWSREEWLVVAGHSAGQSALVELTVDSGRVEPLPLKNLPGLNVTRVVADPVVRPDYPTSERGPVLVEASGHIYRVFSDSVVEQGPDTSASPSPAKPSAPTAPFFLD
jgi:hypothetical protein